MQKSKNSILDPVTAYDAFAPYYQAYSARRLAYLKSVEMIIGTYATGADSLLDVGAGDGSRISRIASSIKPREIVLVEPSKAMLARCNLRAELMNCRIAEIPETEKKFDAITCLWNVLGHLRGADERRASLERLKSLLGPSGSIFLDVNHRYNAAAYGWLKTSLRILHDLLAPSETNGDIVVQWKAGTEEIAILGHAFTLRELRQLFAQTGLVIHRLWIIDYATGAVRHSRFLGQLLFALKHSDGS
jgi:SAM-dependent methyltransferase